MFSLAPENYIGPLIALLLTIGLILWISPLAKAAGLVDVPNSRKTHRGEVPLIGGLAIFVAVFAAVVVQGFIFPSQSLVSEFLAFYLAGGLLVLAGAVDDYLDLSPLKKLAMQILAAMIMIFGAQIVLRDLGSLGPDGSVLPLGIFAVPFTIFAAASVINAMNMSDGLDGLAGSLSLVSLVGFIVASVLFGNGEDLILLSVLAAAVTGFLFFNFRVPGRTAATVFLGDSGSMFLGFAAVWFAVKFSQGDDPIIAPAVALWFVMLPLFDAACITTRRLMRRRAPFGADREHLHHIFLLAGFTVTETVTIMAVLAMLGVGVGLAATYYQVPDSIMFVSFVALGLTYLWMILHSWSVLRFLTRSINRRTNGVDRRVISDRRKNVNVAYMGPERRTGMERRQDLRRSNDARHDEFTPPQESVG